MNALVRNRGVMLQRCADLTLGDSIREAAYPQRVWRQRLTIRCDRDLDPVFAAAREPDFLDLLTNRYVDVALTPSMLVTPVIGCFHLRRGLMRRARPRI